MKTRLNCLFLGLALLAGVYRATAQGTVFTYQGQFTDGGQPANGTNYGMVFYLYDAPTSGNLLGNLGIPSVTVSNGLFTTSLDFGNVFDGTPRWLEISVQKNGGAFTTLSPRQPILPVPYAIFANTASNLSGTVSLGQLPAAVVINGQNGVNLSGTFSGDGEYLTNLNPMNLASGNVGAQLNFTAPFNYFNGGFNGTFSGNGNALTNLNPMSLASGNVGAQLYFTAPFNYFNGGFNGTFSGNGNALTNLNPMSLASGNVGAQLYFTAPFNYFNGGFNGTFSGNGNALTNLNPMSLASGTVGAQLYFTAPFNYFNGGFNGTFSGNGNALTNLNPMSLASGNVGAQLNFTAPFNYFNGAFNGTHSGDGSGLTNLPVSAITGGFSTNIDIGGHIFYITNGIIMNVQ
jgi:hypothetical protein